MLVPIDHVSGAQMIPALFEVGYLAIARAIQNKTVDSPLSYEEFIKREGGVVIAGYKHLRYKQWLHVGEEAELLLKISRFGQAMGKNIANFEFAGFMSGKMTGLLNLQDS